MTVPPSIDQETIFDLLLGTGIQRGSLQVWRAERSRHKTLLALLLGECVSLTWIDESGQNEARVFEHVQVLLPPGSTADEFETALSEAFGPELSPMRERFTLVENTDGRASLGEAAFAGGTCMLIAGAGEDESPADEALALMASLSEQASDARPACLILVEPHVGLTPKDQDSGREPFDVLVDLHRSPEEAWRALEQRIDTLDDVELTRAAELAFATGRLDTSRALLQRADPVRSPLSLVTAIRLARALGEEGPRTRLEQALLTQHPRHPAARELLVARSVGEGDWNEVAALLADSDELTPELQYQAALAAFARSEAPSMATLLDAVAALAGADFDRAWSDGIGVLQARGEHLLAERQVLAVDSDERRGAGGRASAALALLREFLLRPPLESPEGLEQVERLASFLLDHVAAHPEDLHLRSAAMGSFTPNASGSFGVAYLASKLFEDGVTPPKLVDTAPPPDHRVASEEEFSEFMARWIGAIAQERGVILAHHRVPLPETLVLQPDDAMALLARAAMMLAQAADVIGEIGDNVDELNVILSAGLSLLHELDEPIGEVDEISLFQMLGQSLATSGHHQRARQTAAGLLDHGQAPRQRRRAWRAFADILQRCGDVVGALVGAVCSTRIAVEPLPTIDRYDELELRIRLFRVLGLYEPALSVADDAASLRTRDPRLAQDHNFEDTVASVRFARLFATSPTATASQLQREFDILLRHYTDSVRMAYAAGVGILPPLNMLGQLLRFAADSALEVSAEAHALFADTLEEFPAPDARRIRALTAPRVSLEDLLVTLRPLADVRYASDLAIGLEHARQMARRFLGQGDTPANELLVAIEVLADSTSARHASLDRDLNTLAHLQAHYLRSGMLQAPPPSFLGAPGANPPHSIASMLGTQAPGAAASWRDLVGGRACAPSQSPRSSASFTSTCARARSSVRSRSRHSASTSTAFMHGPSAIPTATARSTAATPTPCHSSNKHSTGSNSAASEATTRAWCSCPPGSSRHFQRTCCASMADTPARLAPPPRSHPWAGSSLVPSLRSPARVERPGSCHLLEMRPDCSPTRSGCCKASCQPSSSPTVFSYTWTPPLAAPSPPQHSRSSLRTAQFAWTGASPTSRMNVASASASARYSPPSTALRS